MTNYYVNFGGKSQFCNSLISHAKLQTVVTAMFRISQSADLKMLQVSGQYNSV